MVHTNIGYLHPLPLWLCQLYSCLQWIAPPLSQSLFYQNISDPNPISTGTLQSSCIVRTQVGYLLFPSFPSTFQLPIQTLSFAGGPDPVAMSSMVSSLKPSMLYALSNLQTNLGHKYCVLIKSNECHVCYSQAPGLVPCPIILYNSLACQSHLCKFENSQNWKQSYRLFIQFTLLDLVDSFQLYHSQT